YGNSLIRCNATPGTWATLAQVNANDITNGGAPCTAAMVTTVAERQFVATPALPNNPWSGTPANANVVAACAGAGCNNVAGTNCAGAAYAATDSGWCYNPATGKIWANSS